MKIGLLQFNVKWLDRKSNFKQIDDCLNEVKNVPQIVFLPEMFDLGYVMNPSSLQNLNHEMSIQKLKELSLKYNTILSGSIPTFKNNNYYNTFIFVDGENIIGFYDKVHLFTLAGEHKEYSPGEKAMEIDISGLKFKPLICYDLRFPYISYNSTGFDVLVYVANWPKPRIQHWNILLKARAIENQCYVIGVNRIGNDENGLEYSGESQIIDYNGEVVLSAKAESGLFQFELDIKKQKIFREKLPFLTDQTKQNW